MASSTSSAEPAKLQRYCGVMEPMDQEVIQTSGPLGSTLASFESSCKEYPVHVVHLADNMCSVGRRGSEGDQWVLRVGEKFTWADQSVCLAPTLPGEVQPEPFDLLEWLLDLFERRKQMKDEFETWKPLLGSILISTSLRMGKHGTVIIDLPNWLTKLGISLRDVRTWVGLKDHVNRIKPGSMPGHIAIFQLALAIPEIAWKWAEDFSTYEGTERVGAMAVDALLTLERVGLVWVAGLGVVALAGAVTFLTGVAIPAIVVGAAVLLVGAAVAITYEKWIKNTGLRDKLIDLADDWINAGLEAGEKSMAWVDEHVFQPVGKSILEFRSRAELWVDSAADDIAARAAAVRQAVEQIPEPVWQIAGPAAAVALLPQPAGIVLAGGFLDDAARGIADFWKWITGWVGGPEAIAPAPAPVPETPQDATSQAVPNPPQTPDQTAVISTPIGFDGPVFEDLEAQIKKLDVVNNPKYNTDDGLPQCNKFARDVSLSLGAMIPELLIWGEEGAKSHKYLQVNQIVPWLEGRSEITGVPYGGSKQGAGTYTGLMGPDFGWRQVDGAETASGLAAQGNLVLVAWENPDGHGHIAVLRRELKPGVIRIAQAGDYNFESGTLQEGFDTRQPLKFFVYSGEVTPEAQLAVDGKRPSILDVSRPAVVNAPQEEQRL